MKINTLWSVGQNSGANYEPSVGDKVVVVGGEACRPSERHSAYPVGVVTVVTTLRENRISDDYGPAFCPGSSGGTCEVTF